ncbi:50S ribosomal protein L11 methyltransferase [Clostridiaceae bacterium 68-1-5]|uniref:Ribosomal protein L11 methyltransferase n=1 Tax=Suipraeoptans intestinalis TaxID=2606628 RepID=A0A6N7UR00_9FIRM|nr:50S ribosomal protein L11 methyltransferase [Suipraeoptans intestinalis]MSR93071.1 50S ribosomal protein L11 methyltransferase [Suipraeoptans intestinalis]
MKWKQFRLHTTVAAEDLVIDKLMELGIEGVQVEDSVPMTREEKAQMFVDILPETGQEREEAVVTFYLEEEEGKEQILKAVKEGLKELASFIDVGNGEIEESETEDVDWVNNWKQYFHQFYIDDILITPSWEPVKQEDKDKMIIHIDPGTAFGTGMHETTQLCIRQLRKWIKSGDTLLDIGCGSGILGMLAVKFGGQFFTGIDLDPCAITATMENMEENQIESCQYEVLSGNLIEDPALPGRMKYETYDVVVSNILADVLVLLTPFAVRFLKEDGVYITSGIIEGKEQTVAEAMEQAGLQVIDICRQGEWRAVIGRKPHTDHTAG